MRNFAVIDLNVIKSNALKIKRKLNEGTKFCAVVKADGYGHGGAEVATALYPIVDCYAVALVEEGVALRQAGIDKDILVLIPAFDADLQAAVRYNLTFTVCSEADVLKISNEAFNQGVTAKAHIKYNTGMNRQGVDGLNELEKILALARKKGLIIDGIYSHFARPEDENSQKNAYNKFLLALSVAKGYNKKVIGHISASGGFLRGVELDMVRIGILLYGYKPFDCDFNVKPAMAVYAPTLKTRSLHGGDTALYGDLAVDEDKTVTLVRFGYADGLERKAVSGQFNNRCMDITAIDGEFSGFYRLPDADALAKAYGTISYEILTKVCLRAEKIYKR